MVVALRHGFLSIPVNSIHGQKSCSESNQVLRRNLLGHRQQAPWLGRVVGLERSDRENCQGCSEGERGGANQNGVAGFVPPNGPATAGSTNTKGDCGIRQKLVENDLVGVETQILSTLAA
jgi:hypothetical protein